MIFGIYIIRDLKDKTLSLDGQINGYKKALQDEQDRNANLTGILNKVNAECSYLEKQVLRIKDRREQLSLEYSQKQKLLEQTEMETSRVAQEEKILEEQVNALQREGDNIANEAARLEEQINQNLQTQKTLEKSAVNVEQSASKVRSTVRDKVRPRPFEFILTVSGNILHRVTK